MDSIATDTPHYPYQLPQGWVWCILPEVTIKITDGTHHSPINTPQGEYMYITAKNIKPEGMVLDNITYVDKITHSEIYGRCNPELGDILYIKDGATTGVVAINNIIEPFSLLSSVALIKPSSLISNQYLYYYLQSSLCYDSVRESMKGVGITRITIKQIEQWQIPIPPYEEQIRIAQTIKNIFNGLIQIEQNEEFLRNNIGRAKSKILELAVTGKLVPQNPDDEPAAELLKRINPDAKIVTDNRHYPQLPEGWCVCRLEDIVDFEQPQKYIVSSTDYSNDYDIPVLTAGKSFIIGYTDETFGVYNTLPVIIFDDFTTESKFVDFAFKVKSSAMKILTVKKPIIPQFIHAFMRITHLIGDTHKRYWISEYSKLHIMLPPLEEQERIVQTVMSFESMLEDIKSLLESD